MQDINAVIHQKTEDFDAEKAARQVAEKRASDAETAFANEKARRYQFENIVKAVIVN